MLEDVDLASIATRERVLRHDVKARIEEFNALAGHEHVHKGITSRDLTENVEQLQIRRSLNWFLARRRVWRGWPRATATAIWRWRAAATMSPRRPPPWASGSRRPPRSCSSR